MTGAQAADEAGPGGPAAAGVRKDPTWRRLLFGMPDRLGFWVLPIFLMVALIGAVLAGSLTVVFYSQRVTELTDATTADREALSDAADEVLAVRDEALARIDEQVSGVEEALETEIPIANALDFGVVVVRTGQVNAAAAVGEVRPLGQADPTEEPTEQPTEPTPSPTPTTPPEPARTTPLPQRVGSAFGVARDETDAFYVTTHALVADPEGPGGVLEAVEVLTPGGAVVAAVHTWDASRDLALLRARIQGPVLIPSWRPFDQPLAVGDRVVAVGLTPTFDTVRLVGNVGYADVTMLVSSLATPGFLQGGPVVDGEGRVVGVVSQAYRPFGQAAGQRQAMPPVQVLCEQLLRSCEQLQADG